MFPLTDRCLHTIIQHGKIPPAANREKRVGNGELQRASATCQRQFLGSNSGPFCEQHSKMHRNITVNISSLFHPVSGWHRVFVLRQQPQPGVEPRISGTGKRFVFSGATCTL
ncbi:hypothetical protein Dda3937_04454 [Dickeya dadantii 3937]|uniref:Uncharacterized protein n=1 Tax=Dickeya dadantii (strain 3937) TaxID=198628 RepID=E0SJ05_DICD3|nr:hypothetical protein Dda3937_04454 [Dickeya dadantii 3937]